MAINIQSLFSDIIETPAQRQERQLTEGILRGREITRGVTSPLVPTALASTIAARQPMVQDRLRRSVGGMLGLDVRNESEKVQDILSQVDPSDPQSMVRAADMVGQMGLGAQAAQMRQMAAETVRQRQADQMDQQGFAMDMARDVQNISESIARQEQIEEDVRASVAAGVNDAARQTQEYMTAQNIFSSSRQIMERVSPYLASQIESLFPPTVEGAEQARDFALDLVRSPEEKSREFREVTVVNEKTGQPEIVIFDDNDENYRRVLGVDTDALEANGGNRYGNLSTNSGQPLSQEAFSAQAHADKLLSIAFNPNLESVVGPAEPRRALFFLSGNTLAAPEAAALRNEIERSRTTGTLPIIRSFAPVTETDVALLQQTQLGFGDSQQTWIQKTIEEVVPQTLNVLERSLAEDGQGLSAAHQMRLASSEKILFNVINNPGLFGDYSLNEAVNQAISILPNANRIDVREIPDSITAFKSNQGTIFSAEIVNFLAQKSQMSQQEILEDLDLTLIER